MILTEKAIADFLQSEAKIKNYGPVLKALWYDGNGDWEKAHDQVDSLEGKEAARIHAYLHRKEGDQGNAAYWYRRAGAKEPTVDLNTEWEMLVSKYLNDIA